MSQTNFQKLIYNNTIYILKEKKKRVYNMAGGKVVCGAILGSHSYIVVLEQ